MTPPINIDGTQITGASIDGQDVSAITVDGTQVFSAVAIPNGTIERTPDNNSATSFSDKRGLEISVDKDFDKIQAKISSGMSGFDRTQVLETRNGTVLDTQSIGGLSSGDIVTFNVSLTTTENYSIILDNSGNNYTLGFNNNETFPKTDSTVAIDIVGAVKGDGTNSADSSSGFIGVGNFNL